MKYSLAGSAVLLSALAGSGAAQSTTAPSEWTFTNAQGGFCVGYLAEPAAAAKLAPKGSVLLPAGRGDGLIAAVTGQILDEPEFSRWIPATICIGLYQSVTINDKLVAQGKENQPIMVVTHTMAASSYQGTAVGTVLVGLYSDNNQLNRAAGQVNQQMEKAQRLVTEKEGADFPIWAISFDGLKLNWQGGPTGIQRVLPTRSVSFGYTAQRGISWSGTMQGVVPEARALVGTLRVEGKNDLAKALRASPIRPLSPMESGGTLRLTFTAIDKK